jgi:hypothetical protein
MNNDGNNIKEEKNYKLDNNISNTNNILKKGKKDTSTNYINKNKQYRLYINIFMIKIF